MTKITENKGKFNPWVIYYFIWVIAYTEELDTDRPPYSFVYQELCIVKKKPFMNIYMLMQGLCS